MIALFSKCYFEEGMKNKTNAKGMSKTQNELTWEKNHGFKMMKDDDVRAAEARIFGIL